jgi:putative radical SAM enzyme (TIGR03279 family)
MIRVAKVRPDSIATELDILPGTLLLRLNDRELRDGLDLLYYQADDQIELEVETRDGERLVFDIVKQPGEALGLVPEPDKVRRCTNACPFCFVKGNPKARNLRSALYVKDDDYRLSFLFGHYVTLTNLREPDWERIFEQRLSPLFVSVHATDPDVRMHMLKNPRSADIRENLDRLWGGGVAVHAQIVLCPGVNDGHVLDETIADLYARGRAVLSLSVVPVGLTAHNEDRGVRPLTTPECVEVLRQIDAVRETARSERGFGWCYAADEMFLQAGREPPGREYFDDLELESNGVGAISFLRDSVREGLDALPRLDGTRIVLITGTSMGPTLTRLADQMAEACGAEITTCAVPNTLYGPMVTTAGLLPGGDHLTALRSTPDHDLALLSRNALNEDDLFLDDMSLEELRAALPKLEIWPSDNVIDALSRV